MTKKLKTVVIKSSMWYRGKGGKGSSLVVGDKFCCLGLDALACGLKPDQIIFAISPGDAEQTEGFQDAWGRERNPDGSIITKGLTNQAMLINDNKRIKNDDNRINLLRPIFKKAGRIIRWLPNA